MATTPNNKYHPLPLLLPNQLKTILPVTKPMLSFLLKISQKKTLQWATMACVQEKCTKHSELSEWLIDSGCSNHMTPFEGDLITDIGSSKSLVEVANGNIVKSAKKGTGLYKLWM